MKPRKKELVPPPAPESPAQNGADLVIRCLVKAGVDMIFAYPGGQSIELHQALARSGSGIRVILPRNEQGGAFAAVGYARATGRTGVCMATSGPGATNLVTGIADACMDSVPLVILTGQVPLHLIGRNAFQETDIIGITRPIVKHSFLVLNEKEIPEIMDSAFRLANSGRPGPVVVDIPKNIQQAPIDLSPVARPHTQDYVPLSIGIRENELAAARKMILRSHRPCIYAGGGIISARAEEELRTFARAWNIPVAATLLGIGVYPDDDPLSLDWLGMHGSYAANYAANEADLLIALGVRFDDRVTGPAATFAPDAAILHVDIDLSEINKNRRASLGILADVRDFLRRMNEAPVFRPRAGWHARIAQWKKEHPFRRYRENGRLQPQYLMETLYRLSKGKAVIVPGVGQHQMWAAQYYHFSRSRQLLTSGGLGAMGFGLPAAMGAKAACPGSLVVNVDGDGSFQMNIQELATVYAEDLDVKIMIMNNQTLGLVAQMEDRFYHARRGNTSLEIRKAGRPYPDFALIAKGYGIPSRTVSRKEEAEDAIRTMLETPGPFLLDCQIGYHEHVLPMIPSGGTYRDITEE